MNLFERCGVAVVIWELRLQPFSKSPRWPIYNDLPSQFEKTKQGVAFTKGEFTWDVLHRFSWIQHSIVYLQDNLFTCAVTTMEILAWRSNSGQTSTTLQIPLWLIDCTFTMLALFKTRFHFHIQFLFVKYKLLCLFISSSSIIIMNDSQSITNWTLQFNERIGLTFLMVLINKY